MGLRERSFGDASETMSDPNKPPSLDDLGNRISNARRSAGLEQPADEDADRPVGADMSAGWRISTEIVVAVVVGAGVGWALDQWLGTTPLFMLVLLFLGGAAGINNAVRTAMRMDAEAMEALGDRGGTRQSDEPGERRG